MMELSLSGTPAPVSLARPTTPGSRPKTPTSFAKGPAAAAPAAKKENLRHQQGAAASLARPEAQQRPRSGVQDISAARGGGARAARALSSSPVRKPQCLNGSSASSAAAGGLEPIGMTRAKQWSPEVEEAFRLSEAGYRGLAELLAMGLPEPERWPESGFIRKLQTRHSFETGCRVLLYFKRQPECESRFLNRVKLYRFAS
jgi:hypothetical protein